MEKIAGKLIEMSNLPMLVLRILSDWSTAKLVYLPFRMIRWAICTTQSFLDWWEKRPFLQKVATLAVDKLLQQNLPQLEKNLKKTAVKGAKGVLPQNDMHCNIKKLFSKLNKRTKNNYCKIVHRGGCNKLFL